MTNVASLALAVSLATASLAAQRLWVVDDHGTGDFLDIPPAVAAAREGDAILVRGVGPYSMGVTLTKSLVLMSEQVARFARGKLEIVGLSAGQTVVVSKFGHFSNDDFRCEVRDCEGTVVIEGLSVDGRDRAAKVGHPGITVVRSRAVSLKDCFVYGGPALSIRDSSVALGSSSLLGHPAADALGAPLEALDVERSHVDVTVGTLVGGDGSASRPRGGHAVWLRDSDARFSGSNLWAGTSAGAQSPFSLFAERSEVELNAVASQANYLRGPTQVASSVVRSVAFPVSGASGWVPWWPFRVSTAGLPGQTIVMVLGLPRAPQRFPLGHLWLNPDAAMVVYAGVIPAWGWVDVAVQFPLLLPFGQTIVVQAAALTPRAALSDPSFAIYERGF